MEIRAASYVLYVAIAAVILPVEQSAAQKAADVLTPELRRLIAQFDSDDLGKYEELVRQINEIKDSRDQILTYIKKGIELKDSDAVFLGANALGTRPLSAQHHKRVREMLQEELNQLNQLRDPRFIERAQFETDSNYRARQAPFKCREIFMINACKFLGPADEDIVVQYLNIPNMGPVDHALTWLSNYGTSASVAPLQEYSQSERLLQLPARLQSIETELKKRAEEVTKVVQSREAGKPKAKRSGR